MCQNELASHTSIDACVACELLAITTILIRCRVTRRIDWNPLRCSIDDTIINNRWGMFVHVQTKVKKSTKNKLISVA